MPNSDLVFNILAAAAAFGAAVVLAPSAARTDPDHAARYHAEVGGVRAEAERRTATTAQYEQVKNKRRVAASSEAQRALVGTSESEHIGERLRLRADHE